MKFGLALISLIAGVSTSFASQKHFDILRNSLEQQKLSNDLPGTIDCSYADDDGKCAIENMDTSGKSTLVDPGGETRCIYSNTGPFKFQVWPGGKKAQTGRR